jgi:hypothetical protein
MAWNYTKTVLILIPAQGLVRYGLDVAQGLNPWRSNGGSMGVTILLALTLIPTFMLVDWISHVRERRRARRAAAAAPGASSRLAG